MKLRVQEKQEAIRLRKLGHSYKEILKVVPVAKSSLSGWLHHLDLTDDELKNLQEKVKNGQDKGRIKASLINRNRRLERDRKIFIEAEQEFELNVADPFFLLGIGLYWAEGSKKSWSFQFINSDPQMIDLMTRWCIRFICPREKLKLRLYMHKVYSNENCEAFWSQITGIHINKFEKTIYKPTIHVVKRNPNYKGCLRITIPNISVLRKLLAWQKLLIEYYKA